MNTIASMIFQITTIICGFIVPRLILKYYGSDVNGLVNSIKQFLAIISFMELGVGAVVQSALYKPLAKNDKQKISEIIASANNFFKRLAKILLVYVLLLSVIYPLIVSQDYDFWYSAVLIGAMSISLFSQYYFGIVDGLLLSADQKGYIQYITQTLTLIVNTLFCAILIELEASIHIIQLMSSCIYLIRPLILRCYINCHYNIDRKIHYKQEPIEQKWNGVAQHVAAVVLDGTDNIVLTLFATLSDVSVYSVYHLVVYGIKQLFMSLTGGVQSLIGELWAKQELKELNELFGWFEWLIHTGVTFVFGCTGLLIVPFINIYTNGVNDAIYVQPLFGMMITAANAVHCIRLPYNVMILAAGHYKQTQHNYIIAAIINIVISIITVKMWGLIGVAIGTLLAMCYQTLWMMNYNSLHFIINSRKNFYRQCVIDILIIMVAFFATRWIKIKDLTYVGWIKNAIEVAFVVAVVSFFINFIFFKEKIKMIGEKLYGYKV